MSASEREDLSQASAPRRTVLRGGLLLAAVGLFGCRADSEAGARTAEAASQAAAPRTMIVHRDAGCGCCEKWARLAEEAGYAVTLRDETDMAAVKARLRVPPHLASCHTAEVAGRVFEGHVPLPALASFLVDRPPGSIGLAVRGMPVGSPGMEVPGVPGDGFVVHAFTADGQATVYAMVEPHSDAGPG